MSLPNTCCITIGGIIRAEPELHLFGQFKRIAKQWLDNYLVCKGETYPAQLIYKSLADMACERITTAITRSHLESEPVRAILDPYNPTGSSSHVFFTTSKESRWQTSSSCSHVNWIVLDGSWEGEFCRVAESHDRVRSYVKNQSLGFEVPYVKGGEAHKYLPDFIVRVDDGHGEADLLNLVVEIKGFRGEDAKIKKDTMDTYWIPAVNNLREYGRWAFLELRELYTMESEFADEMDAAFCTMIDNAVGK